MNIPPLTERQMARHYGATCGTPLRYSRWRINAYTFLCWPLRKGVRSYRGGAS